LVDGSFPFGIDWNRICQPSGQERDSEPRVTEPGDQAAQSRSSPLARLLRLGWKRWHENGERQEEEGSETTGALGENLRHELLLSASRSRPRVAGTSGREWPTPSVSLYLEEVHASLENDPHPGRPVSLPSRDVLELPGSLVWGRPERRP
jgi:hypothetical protein